MPYLDDILCHSKTFDKHLGNLRIFLLRRIKQQGVKSSTENVYFSKKEVKCFRNIIFKEGYRDDPIKLKLSKN